MPPRLFRSIAGPLGLAALLLVLVSLAAEAGERVAVGQQAPEIALPDLGGEIHTLSALRGEQNAVLVFFRGAW